MEKQFPKNVRQIGNVSDEPKIYVEDYVDTYLNQLCEKVSENPEAAMLVGEILTVDGQGVVFVSGAIRLREVEVNGTELRISDEVWHEADEERKRFFPTSDAVGWCLLESGRLMSRSREISGIHEKSFSRSDTVFVWKDTVEKEEVFYAYKYGELMQMGGHYIYYEKNPSMQEYMINTRKKIGVTPSEMVEDRAAKDFRSVVREKLEDKEQKQNSRFVYLTSTLLVIVVLAIGISTVNNYDKMEAVQSSLEALSRSVGNDSSEAEEDEGMINTEDVSDQEGETRDAEQVSAGTVPETSTIQEQLSEDDYYVVQKGDTLDSISEKLYGDSSHVEAICKMNGLTDGNLIYIGQNLLLP
ncbi:MAG: LysM peptidoglycan-binding domain-containing protein [Dorea sp.]|nr:LysM peptidoglycan-binding domain-containing protein [Dorea sp.]